MQEYEEKTKTQKAVGDQLYGYAEQKQTLMELSIAIHLNSKQVCDFAEGVYDWKTERMQANRIKM